MQCDPVQCDPVQCDPVQCDPVQCDPVQCDTVQCDTVLRAQAEIENRSMQDVARAALREYVARRGNDELVDGELRYVVTRYAEALQRLGDS